MMNNYKGMTDKLKDPQKLLNTSMVDLLLATDARPMFEEYYAEFRFGFGSNWMKPLFKQYFWWGYLAGYKAGRS